MSNKNNTVDISSYIDNYYREYSIYTNNNRAIPSIVDGLKPVQRKILYCALKESRGTFKKVSSLAGLLPSVAAYHHGSAAGEDAIVKMAQKFNQNIELLEGRGTFGTRLVPTAGAPRYIFAKLSENFDLVFKDNNITPKSIDEDDHPEPMFYLPIIPMVLVNGVSGVAVGFYTNILPRSPKSITKACITYLEKGTLRRIKPSLGDFTGTFTTEGEAAYRCFGIMNHIRGDQYQITELPIGTTHEKYVEHLESLKEKGIVKRYIDNSDKHFDFTIYLTFDYMSKVTDAKLEKDFKLSRPMKETICVIQDFHTVTTGKLRIVEYENEKDVLKDFCDFRIKFYGVRIRHNIDRLVGEIYELGQKIKFIEDVVNGHINIGSYTRKQLVELLKKRKYHEDMIEKLISMHIYNMTKDSIDRLKGIEKDKNAELAQWKSDKPLDLYIEDLKELDKKLKY